MRGLGEHGRLGSGRLDWRVVSGLGTSETDNSRARTSGPSRFGGESDEIPSRRGKAHGDQLVEPCAKRRGRLCRLMKEKGKELRSGPITRWEHTEAAQAVGTNQRPVTGSQMLQDCSGSRDAMCVESVCLCM